MLDELDRRSMGRDDAGPVVDLAFPLHGTAIPADHGYALYAAVSRRLPGLHGDGAVGIHPIQGHTAGRRQIKLTGASKLVFRLPAARIPNAINLAGQQIDVGGATVVTGFPTVQLLLPRASVASRLVVIRGFMEADAFLGAVVRQLAALGIQAEASLLSRRGDRASDGGAGSRDRVVRRTLRIHDKEVVGFAVRVDCLTAQESLRLQEAGLGGRRRFGCGLFVPTP